MNFKEKVQAMTGKEIVMAMINGLEKGWTEVDMSTYGYKTRSGVCWGCAATNTICEIIGKNYVDEVPTKWTNEFGDTDLRLSVVDKEHIHFVDMFEEAINSFRLGHISNYNYYAKQYNFAQLPETDKMLEPLSTDNYKDNLKYYKEYANTL